MSGWLDPVGPLPPVVYWRRRIVVLAIVLVGLILLWWLAFGRGGAGGSDSGSGASGGSSTSAPPTTSAAPTSAGPTATPTVTPTNSSAEPTPTESPEAPTCPDSSIAVSVSVDPAVTVQGGETQLTLAITNSSDAACARDVGPRANEIQVSVADARLWSSDDCNSSKDANRVVLAAGETYVTEAPWDQRTSNPGCASSVEVEAGVYEIYGRNGDVISEPALITIEAAANPEP